MRGRELFIAFNIPRRTTGSQFAMQSMWRVLAGEIAYQSAYGVVSMVHAGVPAEYLSFGLSIQRLAILHRLDGFFRPSVPEHMAWIVRKTVQSGSAGQIERTNPSYGCFCQSAIVVALLSRSSVIQGTLNEVSDLARIRGMPDSSRLRQ